MGLGPIRRSLTHRPECALGLPKQDPWMKTKPSKYSPPSCNQVSGKKSPAPDIPNTEVGIKLFFAPKSTKKKFHPDFAYGLCEQASGGRSNAGAGGLGEGFLVHGISKKARAESKRKTAGKDGFLVPETRVATLRRLLEQPGIYQAPACYDALSASLVEKARFEVEFEEGEASSTGS